MCEIQTKLVMNNFLLKKFLLKNLKRNYVCLKFKHNNKCISNANAINTRVLECFKTSKFELS